MEKQLKVNKWVVATKGGIKMQTHYILSTKERLFVIFSFVFWWTKCQLKNWTNYKIDKTFRQSTVSSEVKILLFDCLLYDCELFLVVILYLLRHWSWDAFVLIRFISHFWSKINRQRGSSMNVLVFGVHFPKKFTCKGWTCISFLRYVFNGVRKLSTY